jgi:hypothetical protein
MVGEIAESRGASQCTLGWRGIAAAIHDKQSDRGPACLCGQESRPRIRLMPQNSMRRNRPQRNNNPGNLRYAKQREASGSDGDGFAIFPTPEAGWRALHKQLELYAKRGLNLFNVIYKYAPPSENVTFEYLNFIIEELSDINPDTPLSYISKYALAGVIAQYEGYYAK